ncbi:MAG TPA: MFS transporter, partial [Tepidisphaeraceae bacterium]|nr:MFS transporter [Tepidisphaeraceae bacterium]
MPPASIDNLPDLSADADARRRWAIGAMLFLAATLNYIDRQTLSILAPTIQSELRITDPQYANVASLFLIAYTVSLLLSGRLVDWLGSRVSMAVFITWWSVSNMLTGWVRSVGSLGVCRSLLGLGEAGNWPAATKAVAEWFPARERGTAIGFYTMGATIGATIAPWIVIRVAGGGHWQRAFVLTGLLGLGWVLPWLWFSRSPRGAVESGPRIPEASEPESARWRSVLLRADIWALLVARMLTDPVWFFYQFWFAKYLFSARHVSQSGLSMTWVIFLAADLGSLLGGLASGWLIRRGSAPVAGRIRVMLVCAILAPLSPLVALVPSLWVSLAIAMVIVFAHLAWLVNLSAMLVDVVPRRLVATAFGVVAAGSAVGGIAMNQTVADLVTR